MATTRTAACGRAGHVGEQVEERSPLPLVVGRGEQLLELIHDENEHAVGGQRGGDELVEPATRSELAGDVGELDDGDPVERPGELLEGRALRRHLGDQPRFRAGDRAPVQRRQQAGLDRRRLADARRPDDDEQLLCGQHGEHLLHRCVAPEEVGGVGLLEGGEPAIGVAGRREGSWRR